MMSQYRARRRYIKPNDLIHPYFATYRESWHQLSRDRFHALDKDEFIFVSGQVETNQWAIGVCQRKDSLFTLRGVIGPGEIGHRPRIFENKVPNKDCDARTGPGRRYMRYELGEDSVFNPIQDQSIFLNFYKARPRLFSPAKIVATSGPHSLPDNHNQNNRPNVSSVLMWFVAYGVDGGLGNFLCRPCLGIHIRGSNFILGLKETSPYCNSDHTLRHRNCR